MECGGVSVEKVTSEELEEGTVMRDFQVECAEVRVCIMWERWMSEWHNDVLMSYLDDITRVDENN